MNVQRTHHVVAQTWMRVLVHMRIVSHASIKYIHTTRPYSDILIYVREHINVIPTTHPLTHLTNQPTNLKEAWCRDTWGIRTYSQWPQAGPTVGAKVLVRVPLNAHRTECPWGKLEDSDKHLHNGDVNNFCSPKLAARIPDNLSSKVFLSVTPGTVSLNVW